MTQVYITSLHILYILQNPCIHLLVLVTLGFILMVLLYVSHSKKSANNNSFSKNNWIKQYQTKALKRIKKQELLLALQNQEFFLEFQPIVRLSDKEVVAMEALIRWNHPTKGILYPASFLDEMVEFSLMEQMGKFVVENAFRVFKDVLKVKPDFHLTINLSPEELLTEGFIEFLVKELNKYTIPENLIFIEITETSFLLGNPQIKETVRLLQNRGFHISLDDFGTGFANFSKLHSLPVRGLKMDRSFLSNEEEARNYIILRTMLQLSEALKLLVVSEGVEEERQFHTLRDMGYKYAQGYYFGRPKLIEEFVLLYM